MADETEYIKLKLVEWWRYGDVEMHKIQEIQEIKFEIEIHEIQFRVKQTTQMGKLKKIYSARVSLSREEEFK